MKPILLGLLMATLSLFSPPGLRAETPAGDAAPGAKKKPAAQAPQGPTVIDSQNMDYDEKTRIAIFTGENYGVFVKDPSFTVNCDKLTAYLRKAGAATTGTAGARAVASPSPKAGPKGKAGASADAAATRGGGLKRAVAEGPPERPVVIVQDKPAANGEQPQHNVGIAAKADYNADTGDVFLYGWPRVSQGTDTQIATSERTIMIMNKDGRTMKTIGPSRTVIEEEEQPKKSGSSAPSTPADSPASQ